MHGNRNQSIMVFQYHNKARFLHVVSCTCVSTFHLGLWHGLTFSHQSNWLCGAGNPMKYFIFTDTMMFLCRWRNLFGMDSRSVRNLSWARFRQRPNVPEIVQQRDWPGNQQRRMYRPWSKGTMDTYGENRFKSERSDLFLEEWQLHIVVYEIIGTSALTLRKIETKKGPLTDVASGTSLYKSTTLLWLGLDCCFFAICSSYQYFAWE